MDKVAKYNVEDTMDRAGVRFLKESEAEAAILLYGGTPESDM